MAGKGSRLNPLTLKYPKSLYKLDKNTTVFKRMVSLIQKYDKNAKIVAVVGFLAEEIVKDIPEIIFVENPFYEVTNSIASLWFARHYLDTDNVVLINGDIIVEEAVAEKIICTKTDKPYVLVDSSIKNNGDYNVQINGDKVIVMSKNLDNYYAEYAGITKLDKESALKLQNSIDIMVREGMYDQWYENALVQLIFNEDFELFYKDICQYKWTEVDCVSDMLLAKTIHFSEKI